MTYAVVAIENEREKILGTIWAEGEAQARLMASNVYQPVHEESIRVKPAELREIPFRLPD